MGYSNSSDKKLKLAAQYGNLYGPNGMIKLLKDNNRVQIPLHTLLCYAIEHNQLVIVKYYLNSNNYEHLMSISIEKNKIDIIKYIYNKCYRLHKHKLNDLINMALYWQHIDTIKFFIDMGGAIENNCVYLEMAICNDKIILFEYLLKYINATKLNFAKIITEVIQKNNLNVVKYLCKNYVNIHYNDNVIIKLAIKHNKPKIVDYCLNCDYSWNMNMLEYILNKNVCCDKNILLSIMQFNKKKYRVQKFCKQYGDITIILCDKN